MSTACTACSPATCRKLRLDPSYPCPCVCHYAETKPQKTCARCGTVFRDGEPEVVMKNHRQICRLNEDSKRRREVW